jgi:pimeloyl-ACP methyl ester carboxylesterase
MKKSVHILALSVLLAGVACQPSDERKTSAVPTPAPGADVVHGYADSDGVKIHYAETGSGPLVVMIHGFPDFWYSWRHQMEGLKDAYRVVAIDQRGYNLSDAPDGIENYDMRLLVSDVVAVIRHLGYDKATIVGHDWGGVVAWNTAFYVPEVVDKLVILNLPHPNGMAAAVQNNPEAKAGTEYARVFREGSPSDLRVFFGLPMTAWTLSGWVTDDDARKKYKEAFERSDFDAMLAYYKQNYPDIWSSEDINWPTAPNIDISTLVFHGLEDEALHSDGLNNTWDWIDADLTLMTVPGAGHFVQQDAADYVTSNLRLWLDVRSKGSSGPSIRSR